MSTSIHGLLTGTFTSTATPVNLSLPSGYDTIELVNITDIGLADGSTPVMRAKGYSSLPAGSAYLNLKTAGAATLALESMITTLGFTFVTDSGSSALGAAVTNITAITAATPAVASTITPPIAGQVVRVYGTTGMLQLSGYDFTVTAVAAGVSFNMGYLPAAAFAAYA